MIIEYQSLHKNRSFLIFWLGQALSVAGDALAILALPLLVLQATGSVVQMGLVTATFTVSAVIANMLCGIIVDAVDRRRLMIICDSGRALLYGSVPLAWSLVGPQLWLIYLVVALGTCLATCFYVAHDALLPQFVEQEQIMTANGWLQVGGALSFVLGPALAGLISSLWGPALAVGVDALTFVISALSLSYIRLRPAISLRREERAAPAFNRQELLAGIRFLLSQPMLRVVSLLSMSFFPLLIAAPDLVIFHLKHDLLQPDSIVGWIFSLAALGGLVGGLLASPLHRHLGFDISWLGALVLIGIVAIAVGLTANIWLMAVLATGFTLGQIVLEINTTALRQQLTPDHLLGRATAASWTIYRLLGPIGVGVFTALATQLGTAWVFIAIGIMMLAIAAIGAFLLYKQDHKHHAI